MKPSEEKRVSKKHVKVFKERKSLFLHLFDENMYFAGFYNMCIIQMVFFFLVVVLRDSLNSGRLDIELSSEKALFGTPWDWLKFAILELVQLSVALAIHPCFKAWMVARKAAGRIVDFTFILMYVVMCFATMVMAWQSLHIVGLPPVFKVVTTMEHMRLVMKSYSFIRENAHKVLHPWHKDDEDGPAVWYSGQMEPSVGSFSKYFYFLFAPTLIYRDIYPRMKGPINWRNVIIFWIQFLTCAYSGFALYTEVHFPSSFHIKDLFDSYLATLLFAPTMVMLAASLVLHTWHNFAAEITQFADREFYTDWWNSESYSVYYRKWNIVVHDWLNAYIYQDLKPILKSRIAAALITFFMSSFMHDYHVAAGLGFCAPVFLVLFTGCGGVMFLVRPKTSRLAQLLTVAGMYLGVAIIESVYLTELGARNYCPLPVNETAYFTFRSPHCYRIFNS